MNIILKTKRIEEKLPKLKRERKTTGVEIELKINKFLKIIMNGAKQMVMILLGIKMKIYMLSIQKGL